MNTKIEWTTFEEEINPNIAKILEDLKKAEQSGDNGVYYASSNTQTQ